MGQGMGSTCVNCGLCVENCLFLEKYKMNLAGFEKRPELAYSCFLCGKCKEVCPEKIDGAQIALKARKEQVQKDGGAKVRRQYKGLLAEKNPYKFASYKKSRSKSVLFPGCNFMSFFPKTTEYLEKRLNENKIGIVYECCGKPVYELGLTDDGADSLKKTEERLMERGVEELIMICPNCFHFLKNRIQIPMVTIYEKLQVLGVGKELEEKIPVYYPCPDRQEKRIYRDIQNYLKEGETEPFQGVQCCGLGGCAASKEPQAAEAMAKRAAACSEKMYTYCASCISNFKRKGYSQAYHILPAVLGVEEEIPPGIKPFLNRVKNKF